ncbi:MAG: hypothetical protein CMH57_09325 [Myxococcales bacterium]|nr:hypothetical protein [Myxococcales bacterium]
MAGLAALLTASGASARPLTCDQLLKHPTIETAARASGGSAFRVTDLSRRHISHTAHRPEAQRRALATSFADYRDNALSLRVLALDLPPNAPLVEVTCAIGRRMRLNVHETLIVISSFGMHAYSGSLTYHELRLLARRHNARVALTPLTASARYAADILEHIERQRRARHLLGLLSLVSFLLAAAVLAALLRAPSAARSPPR